ncbi:MAG: hypothetical protein F6K39_04280 [Okeania sp. SIO3B3]|nr:hypothetical protein [Okeania sp. SIO3B3]
MIFREESGVVGAIRESPVQESGRKRRKEKERRQELRKLTLTTPCVGANGIRPHWI